ncbi:hypothetical protein [Gimesia fumaroli]|uniref:Uncharacterized protein n=1 Tax=Gimesia fumaroli TaxID=2527976 RepID=A0A518ICJ2_9PLAN|nr:hypothetical protein [Gimesia fumaroli]QDV50825.1 hypothetical protein Enr17x_28700 [Gimesia fumaroli]
MPTFSNDNCPNCGASTAFGWDGNSCFNCHYNASLAEQDSNLALALVEDPDLQRDFALYSCHESIDKLVDAIKESHMFAVTDESAARLDLSAYLTKKAVTTIHSTSGDGPLLRQGTKDLVRITLDKLFATPTEFAVRGLRLTSPPTNWQEALDQEKAIKLFRNKLAYQIVDDVFDQAISDFESIKRQVCEYAKTSSIPASEQETQSDVPKFNSRITTQVKSQASSIEDTTWTDEEYNNAFGCLIAIPFAIIGFMIHPFLGFVAGIIVFTAAAAAAKQFGIFSTIVGAIIIGNIIYNMINGK